GVVSAAPEPILVPRDNVNDDSVFVIGWALPEGARIEAGAVVCSIETSKANVDIEAPASGFLRHVRAVGDEVPTGGVLGYVSTAADTPLPGASPGAARGRAGRHAEPALITAKAPPHIA